MSIIGFWLYNFRPEKLSNFNCAGTIADFIIAMLCNLDKPIMSYQMAASWGYFNCVEYQWDMHNLREADFPIELLPEVRASGEIAGNLVGNWYCIPGGTPIGTF